MKKLLKPILSAFIATSLFAAPCLAASGAEAASGAAAEGASSDVFADNVIAMDDLGISVTLDDYVSARQDEDGFVSFYTKNDGTIPYIIIGSYDLPFDEFADAFTQFMAKQYSDLDVNMLQEGLKLGDRSFTKVEYAYSISDGFKAKDTRLFCELNGKTFMFGAKEVPEHEDYIPEDLLESVAISATPLAGGFDSYKKHVDSEHSLP